MRIPFLPARHAAQRYPFLRSSSIFSSPRRALVTLAIETSCDDTSVAILEKKDAKTVQPGQPSAVLHFHKKITSDNTTYHGVHPLVSLESHQGALAGLINEAVQYLPSITGGNESKQEWVLRRPDFISVTRGPGMRSNLSTGLDTAKGLAVAWQIDLVGVHHMQAHALTPRLVSALQPQTRPLELRDVEPKFPFLSVLASGGHTMLLYTASLTEHSMIATTVDAAIGDCLDKIARVVLPPETISTAKNTMYGALLEEFAFAENSRTLPSSSQNGSKIETPDPQPQNPYPQEDITAGDYCVTNGRTAIYEYAVPRNREEELRRNMTQWGWAINEPLSMTSGGMKSRSLELSFTGLTTKVERLIRHGMDRETGKFNKTERLPNCISLEERRAIAREAMRAAFEHLANRVVLGLQHIAVETANAAPVATIVMSGGVAANRFLRYILARVLTARGFSHIRIVFPPPSLCTDNAAMIAWTGLEMYEAGYTNSLSVRAVRKWPLDQLLSASYTD